MASAENQRLSVEERPLLEGQATAVSDPGWDQLERNSTEWEDPDDTVALLDEGDHAAGATVYKPEVEAEQLAAAGPTDPKVVFRQMLLCGLLVCISVYESIFKSKAVRESKFDFTSLLIVQSIVSIVVGLGLAFGTGQSDLLIGDKKELALNFAKFAPPGILFGAAQYVSMIAMVYLSADVFKVLEQSRLLVMGVLGLFIMRKKLSRASWVGLVAITLTCLTYGHLKTEESNQKQFVLEMSKNVVRTERMNLHFSLSAENPAAVEEAETAVEDLEKSQAVAKDDANALLQSLKALASGVSLSSSKDPAIGFLLTGVFVLMSCFASIYSEIVLKKDKHMPFYIQKIFIEVSGGLFAVFTSFVIRPLLVDRGIATKKLSISFAETGLFFGWDNWVVPVLFVFCLAKSWLSGIICKQLSAVAKQLCSIVAVCILYFVILMHDCGGEAFMCPANITSASFHIIVIDFAVLCSVLSYTTALRDKQRKVMYRKQAEASRA